MKKSIRDLSPEIQQALRRNVIDHYVKTWQNDQEIRRIPFVGLSMRPFLREGDVLLVHPLSDESPDIGDLVVITEQTGFTAHRIIDMSEEHGERQYLESGDNNLSYRSIPRTLIAGKIIGFQRGNRFWSLSSPMMLIFNARITRLQRFFFSLKRRCPVFRGRDFLLRLCRSVLYYCLLNRVRRGEESLPSISPPDPHTVEVK